MIGPIGDTFVVPSALIVVTIPSRILVSVMRLGTGVRGLGSGVWGLWSVVRGPWSALSSPNEYTSPTRERGCATGCVGGVSGGSPSLARRASVTRIAQLQ